MATRDTADMVPAYAASLRSLAGVAPIRTGATINTNSVPTAPGMAGAQRLTFRQKLGIYILGADASQVLFAPQQPLQPLGQEPEQRVIGRPWDYPVGWNTRVTPRSDTISFATMQALSQNYDILRLLIERLKDKICSKPWSVQPKDKKQEGDARCDQMEAFFQFPDRTNSWQDWTRQLMDQVLIYDAPSIWLQPDRKGNLIGLQIIDGKMIQPKITADGRAPLPEEGPAYQQVIKGGLPAVDYIVPVPIGQPVPMGQSGWPMPELLYKPRNKRVDSPYGYGPVEQMITTINIGLSREVYLQSYYTNGSTPDTVFTTPSTWTTQDIAEFKVWWDSVLEGNLPNRRGTQFVPDGAKPFDMKEKALTDETDQWLIRIMCFAFGLSPMPFIKMMNRASGEQHNKESTEEGLAPWQHWLASIFDYVMRVKFGYTDLEFHWEEEDATDPLEQAQIDQILVNAKIYHPDELRAKRGDDAMPDDMRGQMDLATFNAAPNSTVLPDDQQQAQNDHALAMQEAKPAPIVASPADKAKDAAKATEDLLKFAAAMRSPASTIKVESPTVNVAPAAVNVTTPPVTVNMPEMKASDVFVDVGATNVRVDPGKAAAPRGKQEYSVRKVDGQLVGEIIERRVITGARDADGNLVAKLED